MPASSNMVEPETPPTDAPIPLFIIKNKNTKEKGQLRGVLGVGCNKKLKNIREFAYFWYNLLIGSTNKADMFYMISFPDHACGIVEERIWIRYYTYII